MMKHSLLRSVDLQTTPSAGGAKQDKKTSEEMEDEDYMIQRGITQKRRSQEGKEFEEKKG